MESLERQKVSYWETRRINIGNYEHRECGLSVSHSVIEPNSGYGNKQIEIRETASVTSSDVSNVGKAVAFVTQVVQKKLDAREKVIRQQTARWEGLDFDTEKKLVAMGIIEEKDYTGKFKERMMVEHDDDDDLFEKEK